MRVTLERPPVNALDDSLVTGLQRVVDAANVDEAITVVHVRSAQKVFCAGADLEFMRTCFAAPEGPERMIELVRRMQALFASIENARFVAIAEISGAAIGGGLELSLACDLRVAAVEAKLGLSEASLGLVPAAGGTQRLARLCGAGIAKRMILGAEIVDGAEAARLGVVQWARPRAELAAWTDDLVARIGALPRNALAANKACIAAALDPGRDGFEEELDSTLHLYRDADTRRRVLDFLARSGAPGGRSRN